MSNKNIWLSTGVAIFIGMASMPCLAGSPITASTLNAAKECNQLLKASNQSALISFKAMFADFGPTEFEHTTYQENIDSADNIVAAEYWKKRADEDTKRLSRLSGLNGELAILVKKTDGSHEVIIGNPTVTTELYSRKFYMVPQFIPNPNFRTRQYPNGLTFVNGSPGRTEFTHPLFVAPLPKTLIITQPDGAKIEAPFEDVVAYTTRDVANRDALFDREFPVAYNGDEKSWQKTDYIQSLYNSSRLVNSGSPDMQKPIDKYRNWLVDMANDQKVLAVLIRDFRSQREIFVIGIVKPVIGKLNGYDAIIGIEVRTSDGQTINASIAPNSNMAGVLKMTNDSIDNLTLKDATVLKSDFEQLPLHPVSQ